jgi:hypothetical protein
MPILLLLTWMVMLITMSSEMISGVCARMAIRAASADAFVPFKILYGIAFLLLVGRP